MEQKHWVIIVLFLTRFLIRLLLCIVISWHLQPCYSGGLPGQKLGLTGKLRRVGITLTFLGLNCFLLLMAIKCAIVVFLNITHYVLRSLNFDLLIDVWFPIWLAVHLVLVILFWDLLLKLFEWGGLTIRRGLTFLWLLWSSGPAWFLRMCSMIIVYSLNTTNWANLFLSKIARSLLHKVGISQ